DAENKGNLKTLLSKKCSLDKWKAVDEHYIPPNGCNLTFSELYAHDKSFRKKVSDAFKESPFDGRSFDVEDSSQLYPPNGDADNKGNLKTLLSKKCSLDKWKAVDEHYIPPNGCNLTFSELYAHDKSFRKKVSDAFKESPFDGRSFDVEDSSQLYPPNGDADK